MHTWLATVVISAAPDVHVTVLTVKACRKAMKKRLEALAASKPTERKAAVAWLKARCRLCKQCDMGKRI